jgi:ribonuclease HI
VGLGDDIYWTSAAARANPILRAHVRSHALEEGDGFAAHDPAGRRVLHVRMEAQERAAMNGVHTRRFVAQLLLAARAGGCTHFAATDGSRIGGEASRDGRSHAACAVFEGSADGGNGQWERHAAYGCALHGEVEVPDAEMSAVVLFLERCAAAPTQPVHALLAIDSRSCFDEIETAYRDESYLPLVGRNRAALLETICHWRRVIDAAGGSSRLMWVPAHVGIYSNQAVDAVAKAFLYEPPYEVGLVVRRTLAIHEVVLPPTAHAPASSSRLLADRKFFRLLRRLTTARELRLLQEGCGGPRGWQGQWPLLDYERLGERRPTMEDAPRWTSVVKATSGGAGAAAGGAGRPSTAGVRQLLRSGGRLLFDRAECPLCGWRPPLGIIDIRHVLCGECCEGATVAERGEMARCFRGVLAALPGATEERTCPGGHEDAMAKEVRLTIGALLHSLPRTAAGEEEWWTVARVLSGMLPRLGRRTAQAIIEGETNPKKQKLARAKAEGAVVACLEEAAQLAAEALSRWLREQQTEDATRPKAARRRFSQECEETWALHLEQGRGERHERREAQAEQRQEEAARRVASEARPLRVRLGMGPVAHERLTRPRWWRRAESARRSAEAATARRRREEETARRREAQLAAVLEQQQAQQLEEARRQALEALAQAQAAAEAARREARLQAELEALLEETASPDEAQIQGHKRNRRGGKGRHDVRSTGNKRNHQNHIGLGLRHHSNLRSCVTHQLWRVRLDAHCSSGARCLSPHMPGAHAPHLLQRSPPCAVRSWAPSS